MRNEKSDKQIKNTSKFISLILRHKTKTIGITLDEHGWADVEDLIAGVNRQEGNTLDRDLLEEIVRTDEKQRYSFNNDHSLIRANQGHSIPVDVELEEKIPPEILWHGTGEKYISSIDEQGLIPKSRLYVHLSSDIETAKQGPVDPASGVGTRERRSARGEAGFPGFPLKTCNGILKLYYWYNDKVFKWCYSGCQKK